LRDGAGFRLRIPSRAPSRRIRRRGYGCGRRSGVTSVAETASRLSRAASLHALLTPIAEVEESLTRQASQASPAGALAGMPVAVKDNICTLEYSTSCGSRILEGYHSPYEATAITRLKAAGALIAGKTNCDEFAMGSSTEHSAFGRTLHPLD